MECPRCGGTVVVYRLDDRESRVCSDCEYVGIEVEHGTEPAEFESWEEALARFHERFASTDGDGTGDDESPGATVEDLTPAFVRVDGEADET
jgi:transcription elongation factor Elf1